MDKKYPLSESMTDFVNQSLSFFPASVVEQGIDAQRHAYNAMTAHFSGPRPINLHVIDHVLAGVKVRFYQSQEQEFESTITQLQVFFAHGGGWYLGDLDSHDSFCANLANDCGVKVTAIDYSLAPKSPYPTGLDDIESVYCRRKALPVAYAQCFIYPALSKIGSLPSHLTMPDAPLLDTNSLDFCWGQYVPQASFVSNNEELIPLNASTHASLPPTMLFAAEYDPLIDDARYYQQALLDANVPAELSVIEGLVHGGLHGFKSTVEGKQLYRKICDYVESLTKKLEQ